MKFEVWTPRGWEEREQPLHSNFRGLRIKKGSVKISQRELEEYLSIPTVTMESVRNLLTILSCCLVKENFKGF